MICEALKGPLLVAEEMGRLGYGMLPARGAHNFLRAVRLGSRDTFIAF